MILGNTEHRFNFLANDSLHLFGVTVDKDFTCKKSINNQFSVMTTLGKLMSTETIKSYVLPAMKSYVLPALQQLFFKRLKYSLSAQALYNFIWYQLPSYFAAK